MKSPTLCRPMIFLVLTMSLAVAVCRPLPRTPISNRCLPPAVQHVIELVRHARSGFSAFAVELPDAIRKSKRKENGIEKTKREEKLENWCRENVFDGISQQIIISIINKLKLRAIYVCLFCVHYMYFVNGIWNLPTTSKFILLFLVGELLKSTRHRNTPAS